ncbi:hypothetical protein [Agathobacter ruminis]|uniref:hypothetical protein n=1 Tax=Agathobacter ruminis TaxID=1712665 RepID=UPI00166FDFB3|nr:hypothetical protein [Agathobacter ruminis]MDC7301863.1 hypothetical protein [Agathobacter ruminis]
MPGTHDEYKECQYCHRPLPASYEEDLCPACKDNLLFQEVKDFIRQNNVNEYQVADHFQIPVRKIKHWIKEGRIEYRITSEESLTAVHCQRCGAPVSFGTLCPKCLKLLNHNIRGYQVQEFQKDSSRMRFNRSDQE